jgi:DNA polymerase-3 subunit delta'
MDVVGLAGIRGQPRATQVVLRALAAGRLPHAYLFAGPFGVGKHTLALALAAALECEREPGAARCSCGPCEKIAVGVHPDVVTVAPREPGKPIVIEQVRELLAQLGYPPHEGRARVIIVDEADKLNPAAQNAFLKTLEEPPARTHIILCSMAPERLLVTIRSRCQKVRLQPLATKVVIELLEARGVAADVAAAVARAAGGSLARAVELAEEGGAGERFARVRAAIVAARGASLVSVTQAAQGLAEDKDSLPGQLELLAGFYRDAAAAAVGRLPRRQGEYDDEARAEAARATPAILARRAAIVLDTHGAILGNAAAPLALETMILALREGSP